MQFIGIFGLVVLFFIIWLMSYHRTKVRFKQVAGGFGLQCLFALIVLKNDHYSFIGMGLLGLLLTVFILKEDDKKLGGSWIAAVIVSVGSVLTGLAIYYGLGVNAKYLVGGLLALLVLNGFCKFNQLLQRIAGALFVVSGISCLIAANLHGQEVFEMLSEKIAYFLTLSDYGAKFLFGNLADSQYYFTDGSTWPGFGFQFAFKVLPTIIFFGGFMGVMYYLGVIQVVIQALSRFMRWTIGTSGAETLSCTGNIFFGQTEAPLLIKPFLEGMTKSELLTVMIGGFATIAGGVLAGYIAMGVPAGHLVAASVMGAPGALMVGKFLYPEQEHSQTAGNVSLPEIKTGSSVIESAANGISDGFSLALNVGAMLIGFIALIAVVDLVLNNLDKLIDGYFLGGKYVKYVTVGLSPTTGEYAGYFPGSLKTFFGTILAPIAYVMGVPWGEAGHVGNLLGIKLSLNEFVAYGTLTTYINNGVLSERAIVISTYALCGFANFASIGIQIGGISALAPGRKADLAKIGLKAMFGGALVSMISGTLAGILIGV